MQFTDSHIHLQAYKPKNTQQIIKNLRELSFCGVICATTQPAEFATVRNLADMNPDLIIPAFGIHPWYIDQLPSDWPDIMRSYLISTPKSMIGECGLDRTQGAPLAKQTEAFRYQLSLAVELKRPLNIHLVHADDLLAQMFKYLPEKFMIHSFSGSITFLRQLLQHNAYISINPTIMRRPQATELIKYIPMKNLLLESDAPFQSDYALIPDFIKQIATIKNIDQKIIARQIVANFCKFIENQD